MFAHNIICKVLIKLKNSTSHVNYTSIGMDAVKHCWIKISIKITMILLTFGVCILNLNVFNSGLTDIFLKVVEIDPEGILASICNNKICVVPVIAVCFIPFLLQKNTEKLKYLSYASVFGTVVFIICLFIAFFMRIKDIDYSDIGWIYTKDTGTSAILGVFENIPTATMAFTFQFNFFSYYKDLEKVDDKKMQKVAFRSLISVATIYLIIGIFGYLMFGSKLKISILDNFIDEADYFGKTLVTILTVGYLLTSGLSFPIIFFTCRNFCLSIIQDIRNSKKDAEVLVIHESKQIADAFQVKVNEIKITRSSFLGGQKVKSLSIVNKVRKVSGESLSDQINETDESRGNSVKNFGLKKKLLEKEKENELDNGEFKKLTPNHTLIKEIADKRQNFVESQKNVPETSVQKSLLKTQEHVIPTIRSPINYASQKNTTLKSSFNVGKVTMEFGIQDQMSKKVNKDTVNQQFENIDMGISSAIEDRPQTLFNALEDVDQLRTFNIMFMVTT